MAQSYYDYCEAYGAPELDADELEARAESLRRYRAFKRDQAAYELAAGEGVEPF